VAESGNRPSHRRFSEVGLKVMKVMKVIKMAKVANLANLANISGARSG
jgi:hypothetical protein